MEPPFWLVREAADRLSVVTETLDTTELPQMAIAAIELGRQAEAAQRTQAKQWWFATAELLIAGMRGRRLIARHEAAELERLLQR